MVLCIRVKNSLLRHSCSSERSLSQKIYTREQFLCFLPEKNIKRFYFFFVYLPDIHMHELLLLLLLFLQTTFYRTKNAVYLLYFNCYKKKTQRKEKYQHFFSNPLVEFLAFSSPNFSRLCRTFHVFVRGYNYIYT